MLPTTDELIGLFNARSRRPLAARDILNGFRLKGSERRELLRLLEKLVVEGSLIQDKNGRYSLPRRDKPFIGKISLHRDGYGFVTLPEKARDIFVPARYLSEVMDGDRVAVRIEGTGRGGKPEGRIVQIVERAHPTVIGRFEAGRGFGYVVPSDPKLGHDIFIRDATANKPKPGQVVVARIDKFPGVSHGPEGSVVEIIGEADDPEVEIRTTAYRHNLPYQFSAAVLAEAEKIPTTVAVDDLTGRVDLRNLPLVTIDGETAKDFDDAVAVRREPDGRIRLWVAIADVGHYVPEGSRIDQEARDRGTSVYFPGYCIPMLPEALSNGICSLNPEVDRLAMVAEMLFDGQGHRLESRFYPAAMRSRARLTYTEVHAMIETGDGDTIRRYAQLYPELKVMQELARRLIEMRRRRGSLDFDLPEAEVILGLTGKPENILRTERTMAHRLIEEFMLAANEAVAAFLHERQIPLLYRIHEPPDIAKLQEFQLFAAHFNLGLELSDTGVDPHNLQKLLDDLQGRPEERLLNNVLLRSLKQARYAADNAGHFGLAADFYCHFTSPIRRYPDLIVHRILREVLVSGRLSEPRLETLRRFLPIAAERTSMQERRAMEAEREIVDLKKCQYMLPRIGEEFDGLVSGVQPFGFFVELNEVFIEGLVHVSGLADDFYQYEEAMHRLVGEHRRRIFQVGVPVRVRLEQVDLPRREIDFVLIEATEVPAERPSKRIFKPAKPPKKRPANRLKS